MRQSIINPLFSEKTAAYLIRLAQEKADEYQAAEPFPHIVIDNFLPVEPLEAALREFPDARQLRWRKFDNPEENKLAFSQAEKLPDSLRELLYFLNSPPVLQFLERLTGIRHLISDPYFIGGGLHQIERGGFLEVHADFNRSDRLNLDRRLNLLIYLNKDWPEDFGGHFEMWDSSMTQCVRRVLPVFNRCVVFSTTSDAYHGHPHPLNCPPGRSRKSLATFYYTNGRPEAERSTEHSSLFQQRPGAIQKACSPRSGATLGASRLLRAVLPPIATDGFHYLVARKGLHSLLPPFVANVISSRRRR